MSEIIDYKGLRITEDTPMGEGGRMIQDNTIDIADKLEEFDNHKNDGSNPHNTSLSNLSNHDADGNKIENLGDPTQDQDAATKKYVDDAIDSLEDHGENNTASNIGDGAGVFKEKDGVDLVFKSMLPGSDKVSISGEENEIEIDVNESNINHDNLSNSGTNTHSQIDSHISDDSKHREIDDSSTSITDLWSANKINSELENKADYSDLSSHSNDTDNPHDTGMSNLSDYDANNNKITNVLDPTQDQDAATKKYVDDVAESIESGDGVNTASNVGNGVGIFKEKVGPDFEFKTLLSGSNKISISSEENEIEIDINEFNIDHDNLSNAGTNTHSQIDSHISDDSKHREIDDSSVSENQLWSSSKINSDIQSKASQQDLLNHAGNSDIHFEQSEISISESQIYDLDKYTKQEIDNIIDGIESGDVDLTNYYTKGEVDDLIEGIDSLESGDGISIDDGKINVLADNKSIRILEGGSGGVEVSGAGSSVVNGLYSVDGEKGGQPRYVNDNDIEIVYGAELEEWTIREIGSPVPLYASDQGTGAEFWNASWFNVTGDSPAPSFEIQSSGSGGIGVIVDDETIEIGDDGGIRVKSGIFVTPGEIDEKADQSDLDNHLDDTTNPHQVKMSQLDDFSADGNRIINVLDPVNDQDVATKIYVDSQSSEEYSRWKVIDPSLYATSLLNYAIDFLDTSGLKKGLPIRYEYDSTMHYGIITEVLENDGVRLKGAPIGSGKNITKLEIGTEDMVRQMGFFVSGNYGESEGDLLDEKMHTAVQWMLPKSRIVGFSCYHKESDSSSNAKINVKINDGFLSTNDGNNGVQLSLPKEWVDNPAVEINISNYEVDMGDEIEISCTSPGGDGDAKHLTVIINVVSE